jgi:hypothetical protein
MKPLKLVIWDEQEQDSLRSEALAKVKVTSNAHGIRLRLNPVNDNFMAKLRI